MRFGASKAKRCCAEEVEPVMRSFAHAVVALLMLAGLAACTSVRTFRAESYTLAPAAPVELVVIDPDVEVGTLTAGGLVQANAEWTKQTEANLLAALRDRLGAQGGSVRMLMPQALKGADADLFTDYERLHRAVGSAIAQHKYGGDDLPTKRGKFDWTLGPGAAALGRLSGGGTHALFLVARDSFASPERVAFNILVAVLAGGWAGGGQRFAYASLVDLRTGDVVWFNVLSSSIGDMRSPEGARSTIDTLLRSMPGVRK